MLGGTYLCYEGAEKIWEKVSGHEHEQTPAAVDGDADHEKTMVSGAIRTDFILSAEIMVIALNEVDDEPFVSRAVILVVVAIAHHRARLRRRRAHREDGRHRPGDDQARLRARRRASGAGSSPGCRSCSPSCRPSASSRCSGSAGTSSSSGSTSSAGTALYDIVHHWEEAVGGGALGWVVNTAVSAVIGLVVGALVVAVVTAVKKARSGDEAPAAH